MKKVKLGEVCEIKIGKTPNRSQTLYWGGDYSWLSISDMKEKILCTTKEKITQEAVQKEKMQIVPKGTVVMSFKLSIGKVGILAENMYTNEAIANFVVKNNKMLFNEYLYYALQGINFDSLTDRAVMGKTLNKAKLNNLSIVFNEPFMQQQIVLRLDGVNKLIESRKQQLSELSKLVKSRFNEMFGDPLNNDKMFAVKTGQQCFKFSSGKLLDKNDRVFEGYPAYGGNGIAWKSRNYLIDNPTIIIGRVGAYCGNVRTSHGKAWISDNAIYIKEFKNLDFNLVFLLELMKVIDFSRFADFSGQPKITQKPLEKQKYIVPPLSLQNEFADFVAQVDKSQLAIQKSLEELETLKKSLMQEYFG